MPDTSALAALIVAAVALVVATAQLTQQLLATAYVIRKCDRIVTGGLTKGGSRQWHWRQFRFTVNYQAIIFELPRSIHSSLGISPTVRVDRSSKELFDRALMMRSQRRSGQACWVSLVQDLALSCCLRAEDVGMREESADRIPDDLTVAPTRVDSMTVLLSCIAMGMQVFKYSPTTSEITLSGGSGSISSSTHPILGGLLHYSVFGNEPELAVADVKRHGHALRQPSGVWANAVFGRFRDRSFRPEMIDFVTLMERKVPILEQNGWPGDGNDTIGGAAGFMAFGHVDVYEILPPSAVRDWTAHFAEVIVKAHHCELLISKPDVSLGSDGVRVACAPSSCDTILDVYGCSSPYLPDDLVTSPYLFQQLGFYGPTAGFLLQYPGLMNCLHSFPKEVTWKWNEDLRDPSSYCPTDIAWRLICLADNYIRQIYSNVPGAYHKVVRDWSDRIVATAIRTLANVGAPSWGNASEILKNWPQTVATACKEVLDDFEKADQSSIDYNHDSFRHYIEAAAQFSILRSAYFSVMMRAAHPLGPGLVEGCSIETAMAYMA